MYPPQIDDFESGGLHFKREIRQSEAKPTNNDPDWGIPSMLQELLRFSAMNFPFRGSSLFSASKSHKNFNRPIGLRRQKDRLIQQCVFRLMGLVNLSHPCPRDRVGPKYNFVNCVCQLVNFGQLSTQLTKVYLGPTLLTFSYHKIIQNLWFARMIINFKFKSPPYHSLDSLWWMEEWEAEKSPFPTPTREPNKTTYMRCICSILVPDSWT